VLLFCFEASRNLFHFIVLVIVLVLCRLARSSSHMCLCPHGHGCALHAQTAWLKELIRGAVLGFWRLSALLDAVQS
jgi:hypothetical protein